MQQRGFTLIELILTMIVSSILILAMAGFMKLSMDGTVSSYHRQELQNQAQFAIEKMTREIRHAVPYSLTITKDKSSSCLQFNAIYAGVFWAKKVDDIEFFLTNNNKDNKTIPNGMSVVITPTNVSKLSNNQSSFDISKLIGTKQGDNYTFIAPDAAKHLNNSATSERAYAFYTQPVKYCLNHARGELTRTANTTQAQAITVANNINMNTSTFSLAPASSMIDLVRIKLTFEQNGERSTYKQDVRVINVP